MLHQRRIYVLPTAAGLGLALVLLTMLIASINYDLSLGFGLTFLLAGVGVASIVHAFRNLYGLAVQPLRADPVFCGDDSRFVFRIANPRSARRPALRLRALGAATAFELAADDATDVELACPTRRRGRLAAGRTVIETTWPLGLIRAWSVFVPTLECLVYPRPETDPPPLPLTTTGGGSGHRANREGDDDFYGLRAHRDSDSPRHVAWKALARGAPMLTKQYSSLAGGDVVLDWDGLPSNMDDEARLSRLSAWLLTAERGGLRYGLRLPTVRIDGERGEIHLRRCLRALAAHGTPHTAAWIDVG